MNFTYKGHAVSITQTLEEFQEGVARVRIDDGITSDFYGTFSDAASAAKQWIDASGIRLELY